MNDQEVRRGFVWAQRRDRIASKVENTAAGVALLAALACVAEDGFVEMEALPYNDHLINIGLGTLAVSAISAAAAKAAADYRRFHLRPYLRGGRHKDTG